MRLFTPSSCSPSPTPRGGPDARSSADRGARVADAPGYDAPVFSEARLRRLRRCPRSYYLAYRAGRGGTSPPAGSPEWLASRLRHTTTIWAAVGAALHDAAHAHARAARSGRAAPTAPALRAVAGATLNRLWRTSHRCRAAFFAAPHRVPMLQEVLYGAGPDAPTLARARARLDRGLAALGELEALWDDLRGPGSDVRVPAPFYRFRLAAGGGLTDADADRASVVCYAAPDLVYRPAPDAPYTIVEFKSGAPDGAVDQVLTYALAVRDGFRLAPASDACAYRGAVVSLGGQLGGSLDTPSGRASGVRPGAPSVASAVPRATPFAIAAADLTAAEDRVRRAAAGMAGTPTPDAFPRTRDGTRCVGCEFRAVCHPDVYSVRRGPLACP